MGVEVLFLKVGFRLFWHQASRVRGPCCDIEKVQCFDRHSYCCQDLPWADHWERKGRAARVPDGLEIWRSASLIFLFGDLLDFLFFFLFFPSHFRGCCSSTDLRVGEINNRNSAFFSEGMQSACRCGGSSETQRYVVCCVFVEVGSRHQGH